MAKAKSPNKNRRNQIIRGEYFKMIDEGFIEGFVKKKLAERYFLSERTVGDIVTGKK